MREICVLGVLAGPEANSLMSVWSALPTRTALGRYMGALIQLAAFEQSGAANAAKAACNSARSCYFLKFLIETSSINLPRG